MTIGIRTTRFDAQRPPVRAAGGRFGGLACRRIGGLACRRFGGFTLVEMMVVIVVILILMGLLLPVVSKALTSANKATIQELLESIGTGLATYYQDFTSYPPSYGGPYSPVSYGTTWEGGEILCQAMVAPLPDLGGDSLPSLSSSSTPDDGKDGNGFISGTQAYGPYVETKTAKSVIARWDKDGDGKQGVGELFKTPDGVANTTSYAYVLAAVSSARRAPVLYYRSQRENPAGSAAKVGDFVTVDADGVIVGAAGEVTRVWGTEGRYDTDHNSNLVRLMNGSTTDPSYIVTNYWTVRPQDGGPADDIRRSRVYAMRGTPFLLAHAGPDDLHGTEDDLIHLER